MFKWNPSPSFVSSTESMTAGRRLRWLLIFHFGTDTQEPSNQRSETQMIPNLACPFTPRPPHTEVACHYHRVMCRCETVGAVVSLMRCCSVWNQKSYRGSKLLDLRGLNCWTLRVIRYINKIMVHFHLIQSTKFQYYTALVSCF